MMRCREVVIVLCFASTVAVAQTERETLERFTAAFNAQNIDAMMPLVSDSVQWFGISGDSVTVEISGAPALARWLKGYFGGCPTCRSEFVSMQQNGAFVSVVEKASWKGKNGTRSQHSIGVYEIRDTRIRRVWYFPSQ